MRNTTALIDRIQSLWDKFDAGGLSATEARTHIGFARTILDAKKVEIAAAHLNVGQVPPVALSTKPLRAITGKKAA